MELYTDGASRGNPGEAGGGVVLKNGSTCEKSFYFGRKTNNEAEYLALIEGLKLALSRGAKKLVVFMDSQLAVRQMRGEYRVKSKNILPLWKEARELAGRFEHIEFRHIPRSMNSRADALANEAIDLAKEK